MSIVNPWEYHNSNTNYNPNLNLNPNANIDPYPNLNPNPKDDDLSLYTRLSRD